MSIVQNKEILSEQIVEYIMDSIKKGELNPGDKLPSEKQIVEMFGVNRNSVREALRILKILNIIEIHQGKGAFVTSLETGLLVKHLNFVYTLDEESIDELLEARRILEPEIAAIAALRATEEDIAQMKLRLNDVEYQTDHELHQIIVESTRNNILIKFLLSVWELGKMSRKITSEIPGVKEETHIKHLRLVEAIENRNPELAKKEMSDHLDFIIENYNKYVSGKGM